MAATEKRKCGFRLCRKSFAPNKAHQRFCSSNCRLREWLLKQSDDHGKEIERLKSRIAELEAGR